MARGNSSIRLFPTGYDLNQLIHESGEFEIIDAANGPTAGTFIVDVTRSPRSSAGDAEVVQIAKNKATGAESYRALDGGTWTTWTTVGGGATADPYMAAMAIENVNFLNTAQTFLYPGQTGLTNKRFDWPAEYQINTGNWNELGELRAPEAGIYSIALWCASSVPVNVDFDIYLGEFDALQISGAGAKLTNETFYWEMYVPQGGNCNVQLHNTSGSTFQMYGSLVIRSVHIYTS